MMPVSFRTFARVALMGAFIAVGACSESLSPGSGVVGTPSDPATETFATGLAVNISAMTKKGTVLYIQDLVEGTGAEAVVGRSLGVIYTGWLANGTKFDSNVGGSNYNFVLGSGLVIDGWDQGIVGMKVGGKRRLVMGSALGYGASGSGSIPPNATLVFDVELKTLQ
jgi:FKBP-type peptidyl-prolyl cis-trans isomerase